MFRLLLVVLFIFTSQASFAARQSCDWPFRTAITVNQTNFDGLNDYPVDLVLTASNLHPDYQWTSNGADLRIYSDDDSTPLPFKINNWNATSKSAEVRVSFPTLNKGSRTIFAYYGNETVSSLSAAVTGLPFVPGKIKFHTRSNNGQDPDSQAQAKLIFNQGNDINTSYGCSHPNNFTGVTNRNQGTGRANSGFIAYSKTLFTVAPGQAGNWGIRYGADFGYGGGLYVDKVNILDENWDPLSDFWWAGNWNSAYVLKGSVYLTEGEHEMEIIGGENCCDGGVTVEFSRNYSGPTEYSTATWLPFTSNNISIRSEACPISTLTVTYGGHDVCYKNLALISEDNDKQIWIAGSIHNLNLQVNNLEITSSANANTRISISLPSGISVDSFSDANWSCTGSTGIITCDNLQTISANAQSNSLNLPLLLASNVSSNSTLIINATLIGNAPDSDTSNNSLSFEISTLSNTAKPAACLNPKPGLIAKYFDTSSGAPAGTVASVKDHAAFNALIASHGTIDNLQAQVVVSDINLSSKPVGTPDAKYFFVYEGYLYLNQPETKILSLDGEGAMEALLENSSPPVTAIYKATNKALNPNINLSSSINFSAGFTPLEFRFHQNQSGAEYLFFWNHNGSRIPVPASAFYHCSPTPKVKVDSTVNIESDPINGTSSPKAIPGAVMTYTVNVYNQSLISLDNNSVVLVQTLAPNTQFFVKDLAPAVGPIIFTDGAGTTSSGLNYVYNSLNDNTDSISFSIGGSNFNHTITTTDDYDPAITHFKLELNGAMKPTFNGVAPTFTFQYKVQVK